MSVQQIYIINKAGSMIYDWISKSENLEVERRCNYPLEHVLEENNSKLVVVFGEKEGVKVRYSVSMINGYKVEDGHFFTDKDTKHNVLNYLEQEKNYPVTIKFAPPTLSANEKISLASMFYSLFAIAVQLSPVTKSSGIEVLETSQFRLNCLQSRTGVKFIVVTTAGATVPVESLLNKLYELYADYALKNPFYTNDMPIRCEKFHEGFQALLDKVEKNTGAMADSLAFLGKIPDQCGYLVISDGAIIKSDGDLANREAVALVAEKMANVVRSNSLPGGGYRQMTVAYDTHILVIVVSGKHIYVVKRKPSVLHS